MSPGLAGAFPTGTPALLLITSLLWIGALLPYVVGKVSPEAIVASISMKTQSVEEAREIGGLALIAIWSAMLLLHKRQP